MEIEDQISSKKPKNNKTTIKNNRKKVKTEKEK